MLISNYSANIVQNEFFEDIPSLYLAAHTYCDRYSKCSCSSALLFWALILWLLKQRLLAALSHIFLNKGDPHSPQSYLGSEFTLFSPVSSRSPWILVGFSIEMSVSQHSTWISIPCWVLLPKNWPHMTTDTFLWSSREFSHSHLRSLRS